MLERALELLRQEDEHLVLCEDAIDEKIERALAQFDREEFLSPEQSQGGLGSGLLLKINSYQISPEAQDDRFKIWGRIAIDSIRLANRIEGEFFALFYSVGKLPGQGHRRKDLTRDPVLFFSM